MNLLPVALEWGVLPEKSRSGVIACPSRREAERAVARGKRPGGTRVTAVCRLPGEAWRDATDAPLLERIAQLTADLAWALERLATWEGVVR